MRSPLPGLVLLLGLAACGGSSGGGGEPPQEPNEGPTLTAPGTLTGGPVQFSWVVPTASTDSVTFSAVDPDGDPLQWTISAAGAGTTATGLSFASPIAGPTATVDLSGVGSPASTMLTVQVQDPDGATAAVDVLVVRSGAPVLTGVEPHSAFVTDEQFVTITGSAFLLGGQVNTLASFSGTLLENRVLVDDTTITGESPDAGSPGPRVVAVSNTFGTASLPSSEFTMFAYPVDLFANDTAFDAGNGSQLAAASDGRHMEAVWVEGNAVQQRASSDGGATWSTSQTLSGGEVASEPQVAIVGDAVTVAWVGDGSAIYARSSSDGGATFATAVLLNPAAGGTPGERLRLVASGDRRYCVWQIDQAGPKRLTGCASSDAGATWSAAAAIASSGAVSQTLHVLGCEGAVAWVAYYDTPSGTGSGVYLTRTSDGGATWSSGARRSASTGVITDICTCNDGDRVWLVWSRDGALEYMTSTDAALGWPTLASTLRAADLGANTGTVIRCEADRLFAAYVGGGQNVAFTRIGAAGALPEHDTVSTVVESVGAPELQVRGNYAFVAWRGGAVSGGVGPARIRLSTSVDLAQTFSAPVVFGESVATQDEPVLLIESAQMWIGFRDWRGATPAIFVNSSEQ